MREIRERGLQAVFLDRDGTIGGTGHFVHPRDFSPYPCAHEALRLLREAGIPFFAATNQHRIGLGQAAETEFREQFAAFGFTDAYICPHADGFDCDCRKPKPGLLLKAAADYGLDLRRTVMIGDVGGTDMPAGAAVGAALILVRTGWGEGSLGPHRKSWVHVEPDYIARDVLDAVAWLTAQTDDGREFG